MKELKMKNKYLLLGIGFALFFISGCASTTKLFYYETDPSSSSYEKNSIICVVDNFGSMSVVSINGNKVELGGVLDSNKTIILKPGIVNIILHLYINKDRGLTDHTFDPIEIDLQPGQIYFIMPKSKGDNFIADSAAVLAMDFILKIYEGDKLESYGLKNSDLNHLKDLYKDIINKHNK